MNKQLSEKLLVVIVIVNVIFGQAGFFCVAENIKAYESLGQKGNAGASRNAAMIRNHTADSSSSAAKPKPVAYVPGEVIVKFKSDKISLKSASGMTKAKKFAAEKHLEKKDDVEKANTSVLRIKDAKTVEDKITELKLDPNVDYVQPNFQYKSSAIGTNDTYKDKLWGLDNTGQNVNGVSGNSDADIDAPEAWAINEGTNASIVVAIVDDGVAYNHPDLINDMWNGTTCKDENGNVLGNCNHGYDFEDGDKTPLPTDGAHGTHIAGTIAAAKNNEKGIIGVAPSAKIMAVKIALTTADAIKGINFAKQNGAKVINASWGGTDYDQALRDAIAAFPGLFVAAAGNSARNNDGGIHNYPSDFDLNNIISVAATDQRDALAYFSDYGATSVDVGAPGVNIYSTVSGSTMQGTGVFYDNFESVVAPGIPGIWTKGGANNSWGTYHYAGSTGNVLYGDLALPYAPDSNTNVTSPVYDLSGSTGADISFLANCDTEYDPGNFHDYMALEYSSDGGLTFTEDLKWDEAFLDWLNGDSSPTGAATYNFDLNIPSAHLSNNFRFQLRWVSNSSNNNFDGCFVDDLKITKYTDGSNEAYDYASGTSMATPHVVGLAALIWGYKPTLTSAQVKDVILGSGDSVSSLAGKTVSGKRINAQSALNAFLPTATVSYDIVIPTNTDVVATLHPSAGVTVTSAGGATHTFTANGFFTFEFANAYGDTGTALATVSNIDKINPVITITPFDSVTPTKEDITVTASTDKGTLNFTSHTFSANGSFDFVASDVAGNVTTQTVTITNIDKIAPVITLSGDATVNVTIGHAYTDAGATATDNRDPSVSVITSGTVDTNVLGAYTITYTATDALGNVATTSRTVNVVVPSSEKDITSFKFATLNPEVIGSINDQNINLNVPYGTDITALIPTVIASEGSSVNPASGTAQNFSNAIIYTITAADNSTITYIATVTVSSPPSSGGGGGGGGGGAIAPNVSIPTVITAVIKSMEGNKITLELNVRNAAQMMLGDSAGFVGSAWQSYTADPVYTKQLLQSKIYVKFRSSSGQSSAIVEIVIPGEDAGDKDITAGNNNADYKAGSLPAYPEGTLLKLSSSPKIYVMKDGKKKWISTPEVFEQLGYAWTSVTTITDSDLSRLPDFEDNLIRQLGDYKVYLVVNGVKRHIPNPQIFLDYGFAWSDVKDTDKAVIDKYKDTFLIKQSGAGSIYHVDQSGVRKLIPTENIFNSYNDKSEDIQVVSKLEMESYPLGNLIRLSGGNDIYFVVGNTKKHIPNIQVFNKHKFNWSYIASVNQIEFDWYRDGGELK